MVEKSSPKFARLTNYLPVTRETTKPLGGDQIRSPHSSWMVQSLWCAKLGLKVIVFWLNLANESFTYPARWLSSEV